MKPGTNEAFCITRILEVEFSPQMLMISAEPLSLPDARHVEHEHIY